MEMVFLVFLLIYVWEQATNNSASLFCFPGMFILDSYNPLLYSRQPWANTDTPARNHPHLFPTRNIVQEVVDVNNKVLGTIFKVELISTKQELTKQIDVIKQDTKELQQGQKRIEQKLEKK